MNPAKCKLTTATVAYVKFDKASAAAAAMEALNGAVLNDGRGPKLKVLLAEEPTQRWAGAGVWHTLVAGHAGPHANGVGGAAAAWAAAAAWVLMY